MPAQQQQQQQQADTATAEAQELLALAALRALQLNPGLGLTWRGALWFRLLNHALPVVRWVAVRGVALLLGLSDAVQQQLMQQQLSEEQLVAAHMRWDEERTAVALQLAQRWQACEPGAACCSSSAAQQPDAQQQPQQQQELPPAKGFVRVCGLEVPAKNENSSSNGSAAGAGALTWGRLVQTPGMTAALESAALALCQNSPVVVEGPPGCGKTTLIRALAAATGNTSSALWLHLDDQQDAKSLLGSYTCSAVPGEFVWQMGPLARAVAEGRWVVIEGVDTAPPDVLSALLPLLESGVLHIPSRGQVLTAAPGFQVLGTVTTAGSSSSSSSAAGAAAVAAEQLSVLQGLFPELGPLLPLAQATVRLVQLAGGHAAAGAAGAVGPSSAAVSWAQRAAAAALQAAGVRSGELALSLGRQFSTRDLIKWCGRMAACHGPLLVRALRRGSTAAAAAPAGKTGKSSKASKKAAAAAAAAGGDGAGVAAAAAVQEAADLFTGLVSRHDVKLRLLAALAALWALAGLPLWLSSMRSWRSRTCTWAAASFRWWQARVGRAVLPLHGAATSPYAAAGSGLGCFSPTGLALRVMERVGVCLSRGEAVLLVGETGTGKTTTLSQLARLVGANMVAFNMSQQTDSSDLLGGYKPPFGELLRKTWKKGNNEEFLSRTVKYAQRKKWSHLLAAYKTAIAKLKLDQPTAAATVTSSESTQRQPQLNGDVQMADGQAAAADVVPAGAAGGGGRGRAGSKGKAAGAAAGSKPSKKRKVSKPAAAAGEGTAVSPAAANASVPAAASAADGAGSKAASSSSGLAPLSPQTIREWRRFAADVDAAERQGALVKALKHGWWLLLDEINLAPPEVLERIAGILEAHLLLRLLLVLLVLAAGGPGRSCSSSDASTGLLLVERGDVCVVPRHAGFRLVAAMNPATDAGKRDLPPQLRSRFTEFWVGEPRSRQDLGSLWAESRLTDGAGQRPAYSLRSLCRALDYARRAAPAYGLQRALWDGFSMSFLTQLSPEAGARLQTIMVKHLLPAGAKSLKGLMRAPTSPGGGHVLFEQFWLERGPLPLPALGADDDGSARRFVLTPSVRQQLCNLARCVLAHKHPILLQGPTSSGKTSLVAYLATQTGHTFVRINNHQHTDLQEYLGSWVPDEQGRLVFREGALVTALRCGHWVVLDELNLAPTEVLEALNRLLDDNRELFVPELQEAVQPHPHFMLFATQNPPGAYAGRKALSRAFRGRFLELHVEELPDGELADILHQRCGMVAVMRELQRRRQRSNVFAGRHGFITPRDLFRWAERGAVGYEALALDGFMVLGERLRSAEERGVVVEVLEQVLRVKLDLEQVYQQALAAAQAATDNAEAARAEAAAAAGTQDVGAAASSSDKGPVQQLAAVAAAEAAAAAAAAARDEAEAISAALSGMVWTRSMKRLYTLVDRCLRHQEPVLLVGETGTGKTSVCQLLALMRATRLHVLNCNQHTETSDFLGGFRPTRTRDRDLAQFRAVAQELLSAAAWQLAGQAPPQQLAAAAAEAASPVEVEEALQALLAHAAALTATLRAALQLLQADQQQQQLPNQEASEAGAAAAGPEQLQAELQGLAAGVAALRAAAAAARAPFGWEDGPLVVAMRQGQLLLVDELNLAEDAVLERLNSVLEPGRSLTLAEKGGGGAELVVGAAGFQVLGTMNPGGDFGKKELSPALSNRFTQIWVPAITDEAELLAILESRLAASAARASISRHLLQFWRLFVSQAPAAARGGLSVRDLLAWVGFVNAAAQQLGPCGQLQGLLEQQLAGDAAVAAGAAAGGAGDQQAAAVVGEAAGELRLQPGTPVDVTTDDGRWGIPPFFVARGPADEPAAAGSSSQRPALQLAGTHDVPQRVQAAQGDAGGLRVWVGWGLSAGALGKAVLLEGSPGVGKTSLVAALARAAAARLVRINCSEHTDMIDLLGADLPAPGGAAGQFAWCDGPLLAAVKAGHWVLLDELNLAGQSVLEGLNGLLDHRQALFVPELGQSFRAHPRFRLFAAQNPLQEGGGRKGLPKSFLNRFTRVAVELLQPQDLRAIATALHPELPAGLIGKMVDLLSAMQEASSSSSSSGDGSRGAAPFAVAGGPWEFNLRDLLRWCELVCMYASQQQQQQAAGTAFSPPAAPAAAAADAMDVDVSPQQLAPGSSSSSAAVLSGAQLDAAAEHFVGVLFTQRLRAATDRQRLQALFQQVWGRPLAAASSLAVTPQSSASSSSSSDEQQLGGASNAFASSPAVAPLLESAVSSLAAGWMVLLVGPGGSGKTSLARLAARLVGVALHELALTQGTDTSDLLGSFEQVEPARKVQELSEAAHQLLTTATQHLLLMGTGPQQQQQQQQQQVCVQAVCGLQEAWDSYSQTAAAAAGAAQQQLLQQQDADAAAAGSSGQQSVADTVQQLRQLHGLLQQLQQLPAQLSQHQQHQHPHHMQQLQLTQQQAAGLLQRSSTLLQQLDSPVGGSTAGRFEWVDGSLTRAIQQGSWVLLDNANLVNPTVLDRLNGLLEPHGVLQLDEAGGGGSAGGRVVVPHPNFRLMLAYDPKHGEVSRAMRNRGVELFLLPAAAGVCGSSSSRELAATGKDAAEEQQQDSLLPPAATEPLNLTPSWALSGQPDLETLLASDGVVASPTLAAMAAAHTRMAAACTAAHRKAPGMREARGWAAAAGALLQQGCCLADALARGWAQAYLRGFAGTAVLAAEGQAAFLQLCEQLQLQPPQDSVQHDVMLPAAGVDADDADMSDEQRQQQQGALAVWPNHLLRPCQWPVWVGVTDLAQQSALAAAARDASLPVWLLTQALAAELAAVAGSRSSSAGGLHAARQLLQQLPAGQQALLPLRLLGAAMGEQQQHSSSSSSSSRLLQLLPEMSITAVTACLFRPTVAHHSSTLRQQWLQQQLAQVAAAAAAGGVCRRGLALTQLLQQLLPTISQQLWSSGLQHLLQQEQQQQQQQQSALLLPLLQQAACHAAVAAGAGAASAAAVAAGAASPYQESMWRSARPTERARREASHPAVDGLQPCVAAVAAFEGVALQVLLHHELRNSGSGSGSQAGQLAAQIHQLQLARSSVWDAVHGPLHLHFGSNASTSTSQQHPAGASPAAVVAAVQPERLAWAWSQLAKAVERLLTSCADLAVGESAARWQFLQQQMAAALQLDAAAPKPLMWRNAGHPQLPPNRQLLAAQHKAATLAEALAVQGGAGFRVDARGQPAGLVAAGVDWQQLLQEAVQTVQEQLQQYRLGQQHINAAATNSDGEGSAAGFNDVTAVLEGLEFGTGAGAELRERLAAAAAAVMCCDAGLRRGLTQGLAMMGFLPHMQLLQQQQQQQQQEQGAVPAACMQVDLQQLVHAAGLEEESKIAAAALEWLLSAAAAKATTSMDSSKSQLSDAAQQQLVLSSAAKAAAAAASGAAALVPLQQLSWLVASMLDDRQALPQQQLLQQVLPGLLHDAWFSWQAGLWAGSNGGLAEVQQEDGTSKAARLQQLSLAAQQLLQQQPRDGSSSQQQQVLGLLLGQLLLAHTGSFSSCDDASALQQLVQQLLLWCGGGGAAVPALKLRGSILLPSSSTPQQQQQQQQWYVLLGSQGWAWLLLGCARLQLVAPPPGVDPAGRYGYKAAAMQAWVSTQLEAAMQVHFMMQQLPGGPDESAALQALSQQHAGLTARLQKLRGRCVPRPDPPQYLYLQQEVAAFSRGLADPQRLLAHTAAAAAAAGAQAVREAEMWDGSAAAWSKRTQASFPDYTDVLQPVLLSLMERQQQQARSAAAAAAAAAELADFGWQLRTVHAALLVAVQEQLAAGPAAAATAVCGPAPGSGSSSGGGLGAVDAMLQQVLFVWQAVRAYEAAAAEEEAALFKHKTHSSTFLNEEEEAEADYKAQFPDHYAAFADLAPPDEASADPDAHLQQQQQDMDLDQLATDGEEAGGDAAAAATAAQAKSAAAKSLLQGQLLQDVVALHQQLFSALASHRLQHQLASPAAAAGTLVPSEQQQQQRFVVDDAAREKAFVMCFSLGQQLVAAQQGLLPAAVDQLALPGSVMALALQHRALNTSAAATAAAAAAATAGQPQQQLDMQQPFPEEACLMQQPLSVMSHRLIQLLEEWPEHPLLLQLLAIVERLLGLPLTVPLKQALTGLELLLARAQVWEETAAKHVSLKPQLAAVAGLATRWRKLELASWKGLLERVRAGHAGAASRSWYHLYQVLVLGTGGDSAAAAAADAAAAGASDAAAAAPGAAYRRTASLVEAFVQTSTVGEYAARLQLLQSFACQLTVTTAAAAGDAAAAAAELSGRVASMLWNVLSYYTQYLPAVSAAIDAGLGPLSKELADFVKLAKWEDRGYYAMKVSTEKAQRQLHRLSRRAEDYLKQPAAGVLATASQAMGLGQVVAPKAALAAAAAAGRAAGKAAKVAAAAAAADAPVAAAAAGSAAAEAPADQQQQKERDAIAAAAAAAAEVDPALLAELDATDLAHLQGAAAAAGGSAPAFSSSLDSFAAAALAAGGWQPAGGAALAAAAASGRGGRAREAGSVPASSGSSFAGRLPKLAARMAQVLAPAALPAPTSTAAHAASCSDASGTQQQQQPGEEQWVAALPALQLDDLAATAASRSLALSGDATKGARLRKKKALTDLLHALGDAGFSKRASDVPPADRDAAAWFGQSQPCLASSPLLQPLLQQQQQSGSAGGAAAGRSMLEQGDSYYFKSLARLQRLQAAAKAPHADLARHEALAVVGYSQHQLHLVRQQRLLVGDVAGGYTQLLQAVTWLQETAGASSSGDAAALLPAQDAARGVLSAARQQLCSLSYQLSAARQLIAAVIPMQQGSGQPQHVWKAAASAAGKASSYLAAVERHRAAVDVEWARVSLAGCPVVSHAALAIAAAAFNELQQLQRDAEASTAAIAAAAAAGEDVAGSNSSRAVVCRLVPSWDGLLDALAAAAQQATTLQQQASMQQQQQPCQVDLQQCQQQFYCCLDDLVPQLLLAAQALHSSSNSSSSQQQQPAAAQQQGAAGGAAAAAGSGPAAGAAAWRDALKPARLSGLAASVRTLLSLLAQASDASQASPGAAVAAMASQAACLLPLLQLLLGGLQRSACQLLLLHKSLAKLSYVCSSIFCSLLGEGYCMPEGQEGEQGAGEGELQWQDAGGTGMGEGTGKKDVSDQMHDEDQLLGAQQKDQQQREEPPQPPQQEDDAQGVEMDGDFEGALHDIDDRRQQQQGDDEDEDEEGDDDRVDQQMGEVGDNEERVDERLWGDDEDEPQDKEQQQQQGQDEVDRQQQLSVEDKSNLDYAGGGEDDQQHQQDAGKQQQQEKQQQAGGDDKSQQQQQQHDSDAEDEQEQPGQGEDEGQPQPDVDDDYQQQHKLAPQQAEQELQLPEDLNLDGMEEDEPQGDEDSQQQQQQQAEEQQQQQQGQEAAEEAAAGGDDAEDAAAQEGDQQQQQQEGGDGQEQQEDEGADGGPDAAAAAAAQQQQDEADAADGDGSKRAAPEQPEEQQQQQPDEQPQQDEKLEAVAAHGAGDDEQQQQPEQIPEAGPQGVASAATAPQAQAQGAADAQQQQDPQQGEQQQQQHADVAQPMDWEDQRAQDASQQAQQAQLGAAGATEQGQMAPLQQQGGAQQQQQQEGGQQQRRQRRQQQQPELNPLRSLGDALERWRADLAVQHEATPQDEGDDAAAAAAADDDAQQAPPAADEYQFVGQHEQQQEGTTQALAPATEEQAALQGQDAAMQEQQQGQGDDQQQGQEQQQQQGQDDAGAADMDAAATGDEEADASPDEKVATGAAPKVWSGSQQKPGQKQQQDKQQQQQGAGDAASKDEELQEQAAAEAAAEAAAQQRQQLLDGAADGPAAAQDADALPSLLGEDEGAGLEAEQAAMLSSQLPPEQAQALRAELDARIRDAAAAAAAGSQAAAAAADGTDPDAERAAVYGRAVWSRCEALVSGLSGELTEQLRLILEPSLASRLGGEFRSGKRLNMKRVIGYIASQFRRDKIWMRRSRPDKRRYQVVVAVDDSRSMAENGAGAFALEALALLCKAMSRLEVGELGVVSYGGGGGVRPLQPLEVAFSDAAGPGIMSALKFDQDNTITDRPMLQLVEAVQHLLEVARHRVGARGGGGSSSDLRQLLLVLGDGRFHEKEALLGAVRRLVEVQGVCPVFIALDTATASGSSGAGVGAGSSTGVTGTAGASSGGSTSRPGSSSSGRGGSAGKGSSLLDMQSVRFVDGKPVFERYLDSFPFPYYIVLRDIAALPATLADLLRQWFELNASSS
ncbi:hypothetical protein COO60DRAFT_1699221 [Scenedesmus sp. NREL 46B-D3]|nr:hypothetical protein COO60DRAFT_1699221 [Scenedesmus sp. NREL 46B-D3]